MSDATDAAALNNDARIDRALLDLMASGEPITHDAVAALADVSRRTVYRRFADQAALRQRIYMLLSPPTGLTGDLQFLLSGGLAEQFRKFDEVGAAMTVTMASAEGRAIRNQKTPERTAYYREIFADATSALNEPARTQAIAVMQLLASGLAWREMRDQWDLDGDAIASACGWAIQTLVHAAKAGNGPGPG